jgi:hypothetical protein
VGRIDVADFGNSNVLSIGMNYEMGRKTAKRRTLAEIVNTTTGAAAGLGSF